MFKRITCAALSLVFLIGIWAQQVAAADLYPAVSASTEVSPVEVPAENIEPEIIEPIGPQLYVNDVLVENSALTYHRGIAYVSLRAASLALRPDCEIVWDQTQAIITAEGLNFTVNPNNNYVTANGRCLYVQQGIIFENGTICIPARVISTVFGAAFNFNAETQNINLVSGSGALTPADEHYNKDDLYWLSHIIHAESGNQPLSGKIAVGNVVMNRTLNPIFPNSIYGVVFQKNQFTPVKNGSINLTPNEESVVAAKLCLEGAVVLPTALWFNRTNGNSWAAKHKEYVTTIGGHDFYA